MNTTAKIILGFVLGSAIGTITGLLMAPTTGKATRKNINKKAKKLVKRLEGVMGVKTKTSAGTSAHVKNGKAPALAR